MANILHLLLCSLFAVQGLCKIPCTESAFSKYLSSSGHHNARVLRTSHIAEGEAFQVPAEDIAYPQSPTDLPELCAVQINITSSPDSAYSFGLFLPVDWNNRFLYAALIIFF